MKKKSSLRKRRFLGLSKYKNILCAILVMVLWGSLFPLVKLGYREFGINTGYAPNIIMFAGYRFAICGFVITLFAKWNGRRMKLEKQEVGPVIAVGIFAVVLHYSFSYSGLATTDSSITALVKQLGSFAFIPLSFIFFKEDKFSVKKLLGAILGFGGIVVLNIASTGIRFGVGELLIIMSSLSGIIANIFGKKVAKTLDAIVMTGLSQLLGGIILLIIGGVCGGHIGVVTIRGTMVFVYICIASIIGYCLWYSLIGSSNLSQLYVVKFLEPFFAAIFGMVLLNEDVLNIRFLLALLITGAAIVISNWKTKK